MSNRLSGTKYALAGVALLVACACGVSSGLARLGTSYGWFVPLYSLQPAFVAVGASLILFGLWKRERRAVPLGLAGLVLLAVGQLVVPPMSFGAETQLTAKQLWGLAAYIAAGVFLVAAFYRTYPSRNTGASVMAMGGLALATGCNCCLVTMGVAGTLHALFPSHAWLMQPLTLYAVAAMLIGIGLFRLGGVLPAVTAVAGQAIVFAGLKLNVPSILLNGVRADFLIKYPLMLLGAGAILGGLVLAYRREELTHPLPSKAAIAAAWGD